MVRLKNRVRYKRAWRTEVRWQLKWRKLLYTGSTGPAQAELLQLQEKPLREAVAAREAAYGQIWHDTVRSLYAPSVLITMNEDDIEA